MKQCTADCCPVPTVLHGMQWVVVALHLCRMVCIGLVLHLCSACTWASSQAAPGAHSAVAAQHPLLLGLIGGESNCDKGTTIY